MTQFLRTRDLVEAARGLAGLYSSTLIRNKNTLWQPIRLRRKKIADLNPFIVLSAPEWDSQLRAWNERGGLLIYDRPYRATEDIASHHAQLVSECPLALDLLSEIAAGTRDVVVIYCPPRWDEHERCVAALWPDAALCQRFDALVRAAPTDDSIADALEINRGCRILSDEEAAKTLGVSTAQVWRIRSAVYRKRDYWESTAVTPRIAPADDPVLQSVFRGIERDFPLVRGERLILGTALGETVKRWRVALRDLVRCGSIGAKESLFCYYPEEIGASWPRIEAAHQRARGKLAEIRAYVEALPEFIPVKAAPLPRSRVRSAQFRLRSAE